MIEYIAKEDIVNRCKEIESELDKCPNFSEILPYRAFVRNFLASIQKLPSVDVEEKIYADWTSAFDDTFGFRYVCSNCEAISTVKLDFCYGCGATMKGRRKESDFKL